MLRIEASVQARLDRCDLSSRIDECHAKRKRHLVYFFPFGERQHPIWILAQFLYSLCWPNLQDLGGQPQVKAVMVQERKRGNLIGYIAPSFREFTRGALWKHER